MYNHNKAQQSKDRVHFSWDILYPWDRSAFNTLKPRRNIRHFADDIFKYICINENVWILNTIWLKFVPKGSIDNNTELVQIMASRQSGDKLLFESMMAYVDDAICVPRPQWVNAYFPWQKDVLIVSQHSTLDLIPLRAWSKEINLA